MIEIINLVIKLPETENFSLNYWSNLIHLYIDRCDDANILKRNHCFALIIL